ncbi:MAG: hypothetical protein OSB45_10970, partial [Pseudomonadales bacterium]|nr:hypothetical protein [Pseudomonadales bacterium]
EIHFANGDAYRGQWVDRLRTGEGVLTYGESHAENTCDSYEGAFLNDLRHGKGVIYGLTLKWTRSAASMTPVTYRRTGHFP